MSRPLTRLLSSLPVLALYTVTLILETPVLLVRSSRGWV